ncbi:MAG: response regulator [Bacteroidales bacterium]|nr:response regulator [Bacteroidales bacterium]MBN2756416.1 response regulator [Bacteroidales bacterium]
MTDLYDWNDKIVLIAEDEEINYLFLEEVINKTGATVIWAKNGKEAIEFFKSNKVDLVLMDIKMPEMNGFEAMKIIKKLNNKIIVIAQTAFAMSGEKEEILDAGFDKYIPKPIKISKLLSLMSESFKSNNN